MNSMLKGYNDDDSDRLKVVPEPKVCPCCLEEIENEGYKFFSTVLNKRVFGCEYCFDYEITQAI